MSTTRPAGDDELLEAAGTELPDELDVPEPDAELEQRIDRMMRRPELANLPLGQRVDIAVLELGGRAYAAAVLRMLEKGRVSSRGLTAMKTVLQRSATLATGERALLDELGVAGREELFKIVAAWRQAQAANDEHRVEVALRTLESRARANPAERQAIFDRVRLFTGGAEVDQSAAQNEAHNRRNDGNDGDLAREG